MSLEEYHFTNVSWATAAGDIIELRKKVFIIEQRFDERSLYDEYDLNSQHILVSNNTTKPIACGRLTAEGKVGRIAVLMSERRQGIGSTILEKLISIAEKIHITNLSLNAETEQVNFYNQQKFHADGPVYMKKGVPFQKMVKEL